MFLRVWLEPNDSPWTALQFCFWVDDDPMIRSMAKCAENARGRHLGRSPFCRHFFSAPSLGRVELEPINFSLVLSRSYAMCNWTANGWKRSRLATEASSHQAIQFVCFVFSGRNFLRPMNENMTHSGVQQSRAGNRCTVTQSGNKTQTAGRDNKQTVTHTSLSGDQLLFVLKYPKTRHQWRRWRVDGSTDEKIF